MKYPDDVLTTSKKGKVEVRSLIDTGQFIRYEYLDPESGVKTENKIKLVLKTEVGFEEFFIIPIKGNRNLLIAMETKGERKLWDMNRNEAVDL